jgi:hypothetical protein
LPPLSEDGLPPVPERSPRNANYTIEATLDPDKHTIDGRLVLEWSNTTGVPQSSFPFHLYWNAFRNNLSTAARGEGRRAPAPATGKLLERRFGSIDVHKVRLVGEREADLTPSLRFIHPDDDNVDDRTVMLVDAPAPIAPGATAHFAIEWSARVPYGDIGRAGWVHDYHFIAQWFPKIGVWWKGAWNCHQFHATSEFFSDYGAYDVKLTVPAGYIVGATGALKELTSGTAGVTHRFQQDDVHDFAWTASRRFLEKKARFDDPGFPPVDIRLLLQPEHKRLAERYVEATKVALRSYGAWSAPYPYRQVTVVDPAWNSASGGMEYPTLFTGGTSVHAPRALQSPESVTVHECGHQFWYGLVGNNEFEEAWLDEGFNQYHEEKALALAYGPAGAGRRYFGQRAGSRLRGGLAIVAPDVAIARGEDEVPGLRERGGLDSMARRAWEYRSSESYGLNSYGKPALVLQTFEALVGDEMMTRILRTYARRFRFAHPTTEDFIATVNEVTGKNYRWFFDRTFFSSEICDYAVSVKTAPARRLLGFPDTPDARPVLETPGPGKDGGPYESEVIVERKGGVAMPVDVRVEFADGHRVVEGWDGEYRWTRFRYKGSKVVRATVDPDHKLAIDVDPSNNTWVEETGQARRAAWKWSERFLLWLQNLLEIQMVLG